VLSLLSTLRHGGIMLSDGSATAYVTIDNIEIKNWFNHGIGTPGGMYGDIYCMYFSVMRGNSRLNLHHNCHNL
jgi:hypothetical protein